MARFIELDKDNKVISVRIGTEIVLGEVESDIGDIGQIMQSDGTFIDAPIEEAVSQITLEDKVNYLYYKSKGVI